MPEICRDYLQGRCKKSWEQCRFIHDESAPVEEVREECRKFKAGNCTRGERCPFLHVKSRYSAGGRSGQPLHFDRQPRSDPYQYQHPVGRQGKGKGKGQGLSRSEILEKQIDAKKKELERERKKDEARKAKIEEERRRKEAVDVAKESFGEAVDAFKAQGAKVEDVFGPLSEFFSEREIEQAFRSYLSNIKPGPGLDLLLPAGNPQPLCKLQISSPAGDSGAPGHARAAFAAPPGREISMPARTHTTCAGSPAPPRPGPSRQRRPARPNQRRRRQPLKFRANGPFAPNASLDAHIKHWM
eukprot:gene7514-188_t